jgi:hypothetical protein
MRGGKISFPKRGGGINIVFGPNIDPCMYHYPHLKILGTLELCGRGRNLRSADDPGWGDVLDRVKKNWES